MENQTLTTKQHLSLTLQKQSRPLLAKISEDYPKIKRIENEAETNGLMNYLLAIMNIKINSNDQAEVKAMSVQMLVILDFIKTKFGSLTIPEIKEAFKMYVAKEFPEIKVFRILDCVAVGEILSAFTNFRADALRRYDSQKQLLLTQTTEITESEKQAIHNEFLKQIFENLKARGYSDDIWHLWENRNELTNFAKKVNATITNSEKKTIYEREESLYLRQLKNEQLISRRISAKTAVDDFVRRMKANEKNGIVVNRCRNIIGSKYLKDCLKDFEQFKNQIG